MSLRLPRLFSGPALSSSRPHAVGLASSALALGVLSLLFVAPAMSQVTNNGTLRIFKDATPSTSQAFGFTGPSGSFSLTGLGDSSSVQTYSLAAGSYTVTEIVPAGWELDDISCSTGIAERGVSRNSVNANVVSGQLTTCTFTNLELGSVTVVLEATPESSDSFGFTGTFGTFSLVDDGTATDRRTFEASSTASLSIGLTVPAGWSLTASGCTGQNGRRILPVASNPLTPNLSPGQDITCTFEVEDQRVDLSLDKTVLTNNPVAGGQIEYEIVVANAGPGDAFDVPVTDTMPTGLSNASWACQAVSNAECDNGSTTETGNGDLDEVVQLPANTSVTYNVLATIDPDFEGELINSAQIVLGDTVLETTPENNAGSASVLIGSVVQVPVQTPLGRLGLISLIALLGAWSLRRLT